MLCKVSMQHPTFQCLGPLVLLISPLSRSLPLAETSHHLAPLPLNAWKHPLSEECQLGTKHVEKGKRRILGGQKKKRKRWLGVSSLVPWEAYCRTEDKRHHGYHIERTESSSTWGQKRNEKKLSPLFKLTRWGSTPQIKRDHSQF